jgi:RNA polymerase sigma factor (sigma-70 family)
MQVPQEIERIAECKRFFIENDVAGKWQTREADLDYDALSEEVIRHYFEAQKYASQPPLETIVYNFIQDYPLIHQLPLDLVCQRELDQYLNRMVSMKFTSLPYFLMPKDIVQETMYRILNNLNTFHYAARFWTWCTTILSNTGIELIERENRRAAIEGMSLDEPIRHGEDDQNRHDTTPSGLPDPEEEYSREERKWKELRPLIDRALEKSKKKNKERDLNIILMKLEDMPSKSIANELGIGFRTVDMFMHRLRGRMKQIAEAAEKISQSNERSFIEESSKRTGVTHEL